MFQSLFYWKYHFNGVAFYGNKKEDCVSILILLEVPLQLYLMIILLCMEKSFNPYFTGSTTSTQKLFNGEI